MNGITLDTGALIALERRETRMAGVFATAERRDVSITVPAPVWAQWWRGGWGGLRRLLGDRVVVEPLDEGLATEVGEALAIVGTADIVDAAVVVSAARRGDVVYTSDYDDLRRIAERVRPGVRILRT